MPRFPVVPRHVRRRVAPAILAILTAGSPIVAGFHEAPNVAQLIGMTSALLLAAYIAASSPAVVTTVKKMP